MTFRRLHMALIAALLIVAASSSTLWAAISRTRYDYYTLGLDVAFTYDRSDSDGEVSSSFRQNYVLTHTGKVLDSRLLTYNTSLGFTHTMNFEGGASGDMVSSAHVGLSFFNKIDRSRGAMFLKYVPSPLILDYQFLTSKNYVVQTYRVGLYYYIPGYIVFFTKKGGWVSYSLTKPKPESVDSQNNNNASRYRSKYSNSGGGGSGGSGDNNWNRNGNGGWNRNGNGGWNRNGNGGWNRNGNGGTGPNGQNNGQANPDAIREEPRKPLYIVFPFISFDYNKNEIVNKVNDLQSSSSLGDLRASSSNPGEDYSSRYDMSYSFSANDSESSTLFVLSANNKWSNSFSLENKFSRAESSTGVGYTDLFSSADYSNWYKTYPYGFGLYGEKYDGSNGQALMAGGYAIVSGSKGYRKVFSPKLETNTALSGYLRGVAVQKSGDMENLNSQNTQYALTFQEQAYSKHIQSFDIKGVFTATWNEISVPMSLTVTGTSRGFRTLFVETGMRVSRNYLRSGIVTGGSEEAHLNIKYRYSSRVDLRNENQISSGWEDGASRETARKNVFAVESRLSMRTTLVASFTMDKTNSMNSNAMMVNCRTSWRSWGSLTAEASRTMSNFAPRNKENFFLRYDVTIRRLSVASELSRSSATDQPTNTTLWITVSRHFERRWF